jgi:uncharacterized protein
MNVNGRIAAELSVSPAQVTAAVRLLDEGATVPFLARYRKEATGGLDDTQLRRLEERLGYLRELEGRRETVLKAIAEQGKLESALEAEIRAAETKTRLEDLYRPFMKKRRSKAQIAREAGLEPLALRLLQHPDLVLATAAADYLNPQAGFADTDAALDGARQILMERFAEDPGLVGELRERLWSDALLRSRVVDGKSEEGVKFSDYFDYAEPVHKVPSHRALALFRGRREGALALSLALPEDERESRGAREPGVAERRIALRFGISDRGRPADSWLQEAVRWAWRVKLSVHLETDLMSRLRERAEAEAISVFGYNLRDLLLAAPAGQRATMGLDPGLRTGVKVAVVNDTGKLVDTATIYPHPPRKQWDTSLAALAALSARHRVELVSIGNGTGSRETDRLVAELAQKHPELGLTRVTVSEAGASVYSASELAANEFPTLDVSLRGAVSIARRLQDPLAELVKIEPKAIGVGQYQHDVSQSHLARTLNAVVEDCVNAVGVDLNTASTPLLARVSGLGPALAGNIVSFRDEHGAFRNRRALLKVPRLGQKAFEQSAGFLRVVNGDTPLDASAVHPEAYPVVKKIVASTGRAVEALLGDSDFLHSLRVEQFVDERFGEPTVRDILAELEKPGRDPRPEFRTALFQEGIESLADLKPGQVLEGVVTNVTNFGAFVDVGVHQDGLVHISALAARFVKDPREVVRAGQLVKVKVMSVDLPRRRIGLSMRLGDDSTQASTSPAPAKVQPAQAPFPHRAETPKPARAGALADAFARAKAQRKR